MGSGKGDGDLELIETSLRLYVVEGEALPPGCLAAASPRPLCNLATTRAPGSFWDFLSFRQHDLVCWTRCSSKVIMMKCPNELQKT